MVPSTTSPSVSAWSQGPVLVLEASTANASVAVIIEGTVRSAVDATMGASREDALFPAVVQALAHAGVSPLSLHAVVCGSGPGSFTSLRIAAALAKGLVQERATPLVAVPSLLLAAATHGVPGAWVLHADALRGDRYALPVTIDGRGHAVATGPVQLVAASALESTFPDRVAVTARPEASALVRVQGWAQLPVCDVATWEPAYGRLAEAQVQWEATHARPLPAV